MTPRQIKINEIVDTYIYFRGQIEPAYSEEKISNLRKLIIWEVEGCTLFSLGFCRGLTKAIERFEAEMSNDKR